MSVYIHLWHGRKAPDEIMEDWGTTGPYIGPFDGVQTTYRDEVKGIIDGNAEIFLHPTADGLIHFRGVWYGEWTVVSEPPGPGFTLIGPDDVKPEERDEECGTCFINLASSRVTYTFHPQTGLPFCEICDRKARNYGAG